MLNKLKISVSSLLAGFALAGTLTLNSTIANADTNIRIGVLSCDVESGSGFIVGSRKDMNCLFNSTNGYTEIYSGVVKKFGIDIGTTDRTTIKWVVFAPSSDFDRGALAGGYGGLSAEATAGYGVGANAMIGGSDRSVILQPFSGQVQEGLNIAVGIGTMTLVQ
jgi:hypothetical protein